MPVPPVVPCSGRGGACGALCDLAERASEWGGPCWGEVHAIEDYPDTWTRLCEAHRSVLDDGAAAYVQPHGT